MPSSFDSSNFDFAAVEAMLLQFYSQHPQYAAYAKMLGQQNAMAKIPQAVQVLASGRPEQIHQLLIAVILRSEDELLSVTGDDMARAAQYTLITTHIAEEDAVVLTVRPK